MPRSVRIQCGIPNFSTTSCTRARATVKAVLLCKGVAITKRAKRITSRHDVTITLRSNVPARQIDVKNLRGGSSKQGLQTSLLGHMTPIKLITVLAAGTVEFDIRLPTIAKGSLLHLSQSLLIREMTSGLHMHHLQKTLTRTSRHEQLQILIGSIGSLEPPIHNALY